VNRGTLVTFTGTTPNIGTTISAFSAACRIAEYSGQPVGYLCLNLKSSKLHRYVRVERPALSLDRMRPELKAATLSPERLKAAAFRPSGMPNLFVFFGNLLRDQAEFYAPEEIGHLLDAAREAFCLTIADVSAYWDNAATVAAMRAADSRIVATTTALSHFQEDGRRWFGLAQSLFGIEPADCDAVIISPPWRNGGFSLKDVQKETGLRAIGRLNLTEPLLAALDNGALMDWLLTDDSGRKAMDDAARELMNRHGVRFGRSAAQQPWYRRLLAHRNGVS
jgi:hypothetical protein